MGASGPPASVAYWGAVALTGWQPDKNRAVVGAIIIAVVLIVAIPVGVLMSGSVGAGLLGWLLKDNADASGEDVWKELNY